MWAFAALAVASGWFATQVAGMLMLGCAVGLIVAFVERSTHSLRRWIKGVAFTVAVMVFAALGQRYLRTEPSNFFLAIGAVGATLNVLRARWISKIAS